MRGGGEGGEGQQQQQAQPAVRQPNKCTVIRAVLCKLKALPSIMRQSIKPGCGRGLLCCMLL
jgi:hypothetical protein